MKTAAVIAEFNPFHKGHAYLLEKAREISGAGTVIALMSGNFVQRGEPSIFDMGIRAKAALEKGFDLVLELPPYAALSSAEGFADGAVKILQRLGTDCLVFGSECGNADILSSISEIISEECGEYKACLSEGLRSGLSFPAARENAVISCISDIKTAVEAEKLHEILHNPNDILSLEYLKALKKTGSGITPFPVKRTAAPYHGNGNNTSYSAESIRNSIYSGDFSGGEGLEYIETAVKSFGSVHRDALTPYLYYKLQSGSLPDSLYKASVPEDLSNRILKNRDFTGSFSEYCDLLKSKNITYTAVSRHLLHLILEIDYRNYDNDTDYVRLLGFREEAKDIFNEIRKRSALRLISNSSDIKSYIKCNSANSALGEHLRIDRFYDSLRTTENRRLHPLPPEISREIIIM